MDAAALKNAWVRGVREILGHPEYRVGRKWDETFARVASTLDGVDPSVFAECQIRFMIARGAVAKMFPNILSGPSARQRYDDAQILGPAETLELAAQRYAIQLACFKRVVENLGEEYAFSGSATEYSPLFLAFMMWGTNRPLSDELRQKALMEVRKSPVVINLFPGAFMQRIQE